MDKKFFNKTLNFLKKEGFYVILFVCLCIVATVAALTARNNKHINNTPAQQSSSVQQKQSKETAKAGNEPSLNYDNALQVKKNTKPEIVVPKNDTNSKGVSNSVNVAFQKPVEGSLARNYSEDPVFWDSTGSYRPNLGYDIKAELGKPVLAVADGKVEQVNSATQDGVEITINHQNGIKTVYSNLDPKVKVTKGQMVTKGTAIGVVGKSTLRAAYEKYGDHLHFAVLKGKDFVDPSKYLKY